MAPRSTASAPLGILCRDHDREEVHEIRATQYQAPSWSWALATTFIRTPRKHQPSPYRIYLIIEEAQVQPAAGHDDTGQLKGGHIRLTGAPIAAELVRPTGIGHFKNLVLNVNGQTCEAMIRLDARVAACPVPVTLLPIIRGDVDREDLTRALLLDAVEGKPQGWYARLGMIYIPSRDALDEIVARISDPSLWDASLCLEESPGTVMLI